MRSYDLQAYKAELEKVQTDSRICPDQDSVEIVVMKARNKIIRAYIADRTKICFKDDFTLTLKEKGRLDQRDRYKVDIFSFHFQNSSRTIGVRIDSQPNPHMNDLDGNHFSESDLDLDLTDIVSVMAIYFCLAFWSNQDKDPCSPSTSGFYGPIIEGVRRKIM